MSLRERITNGLKDAMREKDAARLSTLRLINAAIKDQDIAARGAGKTEGVDEGEILAILAKMVKQRIDSANVYVQGGRLELAEKERAEIKVIEGFLPRQLSETEIASAIDAAIDQTGASSIRDMGRVMGALKAAYAGQMDFGAAGALIKERLA